MVTGKISSYQTLGTVDGPGIRFVAFLQGCPLRCVYCHNPETWEFESGRAISARELFDKAARYKSYFGPCGGVTVSGGEPLMQQGFLIEFFRLCKEGGIHTALDTSGCILDDMTEQVLSLTDLVLLDIKFTTEEEYKRYTGGSLLKTLRFLELAGKMGKELWIRQVIIKGINDNHRNLKRLNEIIKKHENISKIELLPFQKLCVEKYEALGVDFKLKDMELISDLELQKLYNLLDGPG